MAKPKLQIALDSQSLSEALVTVREVGDVVDILEVGTVLCLQDGMEPVRAILEENQNQKIPVDAVIVGIIDEDCDF